jgi:transcriptional regulator with XRE-family HTH domain
MGRSVPKPKRRRTYIREWRLERGHSQEELADIVGVTQETISKLERGKFDYTQGTLEAIADALHCTVGQLTDHNPEMDGALVKLAREIPKEHETQAADILRTFLKKAG